MLIDSHCHLTDRKFAEPGEAAACHTRARAAGVDALVIVGVDLEDSRRALDLARALGCGATAGVHPHDAAKAGPAELESIAELYGDERCVAAGEMGLDYHYDLSPRAVQRKILASQLESAHAAGLPCVVHTREAEADTVDLLNALPARENPGVIHCFTGSAWLAERCLERGWYISFSGIVTFANAGPLREIAARVPAERLLVETDSPYLAPVPHRGKRNEPAYVREVAAAMAVLRGEAPEALEHRCAANTLRLFPKLAPFVDKTPVNP